MTKLEKFLFQLTIFLIPTNLAYHWILPESYVNGILVDYLIPKLYLSDLPLLLLLFLWFTKSLPILSKPITFPNRRKSGGENNFFEISRTRLTAWHHSLFTKASQTKSLEISKKCILTALAGSLFFILFLHSTLTPHPLASVWYWLKLLEFSLFFLWISHHHTTSIPPKNLPDFDEANNFFEISRTRLSAWLASRFITSSHAKSPEIAKKFIGEVLITPLLLAMAFQSLLALYQFITQHSLIGYLFLGETTLTNTANILKSTIWPLEGIRILPYGTTPHPNVLAGFLTLYLLILLSTFKSSNKPGAENNFFWFALTWLKAKYQLIKSENSQVTSFANHKKFILAASALSMATLYLTQSLSAWIALAIGVCVVIYKRHRIALSVKYMSVVFLIALSLTTYYLLLTTLPLLSTDSYTRRQQLNQISLEMIKDHPIMGIGLNQFTAKLPEYGTIQAYTSFLQPAHNIFLLWLTETGIVGFLFIFFLLKKIKKPTPNYRLQTTAPIIAIVIIGALDHYLLTLQSGQLLLTITLALSSSLDIK